MELYKNETTPTTPGLDIPFSEINLPVLSQIEKKKMDKYKSEVIKSINSLFWGQTRLGTNFYKTSVDLLTDKLFGIEFMTCKTIVSTGFLPVRM